ncbi:MAG TPA: branched-chain amino acid ABC transporter ATP-binding protein/permease [bacterium]|nr:branched-chain amino acid ABC transporter ATP-binding protein/permease [bacterium]
MTQRAWLLGLIIVLIITPSLVAGRVSLGIFIFIGLFSLIVIGLTLLAGHAGQVSLGQAAFYGIGAYVSAITTLRLGLPPFLGVMLAVSGAAFIAYVIGAPIFLLRGHFLVLGTLGFNIVVDVVIRNVQGLTGGPTGLTGIPPLSVGRIIIVGDRAYYYLIWTLVLLALWLGRNLIHSRIGRALAAIRASEVTAATLGINPAFFKARMLALSAAFAGLAGAIYVHYLGFVSPSPFAFNFSIDLLVMSVLGGIAFLPGAVLGTAVLTVLREVLRTIMPRLLGTGASAEYEIVIFGLLLAVVVVLAPGGIWPWVAAVFRLNAKRPEFRQESVAAGLAPSPSLSLQRGETLLKVDKLQKRFGGLLAVSGLSFEVKQGEIYAMIGPNGAGKTTAFNLISGVLRATSGDIAFKGQTITHLQPYAIAGLGVARTFQTPRVFGDLTVLNNVMIGMHRSLGTGFLGSMLGLGRREDRRAAADAAGYLERVGLLDRAMDRSGALPFGAQRFLELARALAAQPALLLLDEPASGLSTSERGELVRLIRQIRDAGITVLLVEHDVSLVMGLVDRILVLNYGEQIAEGTPAQVRADPRVIAAYLGDDEVAS